VEVVNSEIFLNETPDQENDYHTNNKKTTNNINNKLNSPNCSEFTPIRPSLKIKTKEE